MLSRCRSACAASRAPVQRSNRQLCRASDRCQRRTRLVGGNSQELIAYAQRSLLQVVGDLFAHQKPCLLLERHFQAPLTLLQGRVQRHMRFRAHLGIQPGLQQTAVDFAQLLRCSHLVRGVR